VTDLLNTFEGFTEGTAPTTGNSGGASGDAFAAVSGTGLTVKAAAARTGSFGLEVVAPASTTHYVALRDAAGAGKSFAYAFDVYLPDGPHPTNSQPLSYLRAGSTGGTGVSPIQLRNSTGRLFFTSDPGGGANLGETTSGLAADTAYCVSVYGHLGTTTSNGECHLRVFDAADDTNTPLSGLSLDLTGVNMGTSTSATECRFGRTASVGGAFTAYFDNLRFRSGSEVMLGTYSPVVPNVPPTADAGSDQLLVDPGVTVNLTGTDSDSDGTVVTRAWTQVSGPAVMLTGAATANASFTAPYTADGATLVFQYTATDDDGASASDTVTVTVDAWPDLVAVGGIWTPYLPETL
jgi:hypothetical protein